MSGVWVLKNGVVRLVENPAGAEDYGGKNRGRKVLLHTPTGEVIRSYSVLEKMLLGLGWERYYGKPELLQFHKRGSLDLISFPNDFSRFSSVHMYEITISNRDAFRVIDA